MYKYEGLVMRVIDGDTIVVLVDLGFTTFSKQTLRLYGINAPEMRSGGEMAKEWLEKQILQKQVTIETIKKKRVGGEKTGKYGRYLAIVSIDGVDINQVMLDEGLAREYNG